MAMRLGGHALEVKEEQHDSDPEWCVGDVEWDAIRVTAHTVSSAHASPSPTSGSAPAKGSAALRTANTSCQVEGCNEQLLPLRSYYQRQHICENHFRALVITDASGRVTRFCQQCTKLEPLQNFDGERRSCRASLERRNQRRHGKRAGKASKARRASKPRTAALGVANASCKASSKHNSSVATAAAAAAAHAPHTDSGSGSGSSTAELAHRLGSPAHQPTVSDGVQGARQPRAALTHAVHAGGATAWVPDHTSRLAQHPQQARLGPGPATAYWLSSGRDLGPSGPTPSAVSAADTVAAGQFACGVDVAGTHAVRLGQLPLRGRGSCETSATPGMSLHDVDDLLAMDTDKLRQAIVASGLLPEPEAAHVSGRSSASASAADAPSPGQSSAWHMPAGNSMGAAPDVLHGGAAAALLAERQGAALRHTAASDPWLHPFAGDLLGEAQMSAAHIPHPVQPVQRQPEHPHLQAARGAKQGWQLHAAPSGCKPEPCAGVGPSYFDLGPVLPYAAPGMAAPPGLSGAALCDELAVREADMWDVLESMTLEYEEARMSLKIYGLSPEQLPVELRYKLLTALELPSTHMEASLRAGCVHLTVDALVSAAERERLTAPGAAAAMAARLAPLAQALPSPARLVVQMGQSSAALLACQRGSGTALLLSLPAAGGAAGQQSVLPPAAELAEGAVQATTVSAAGGRFCLRCPRALLWGDSGLRLHCRSAGRHEVVSLHALDVEVPATPEPDSSEASKEGMDYETDSGSCDSASDMVTDSDEEEAAAEASGSDWAEVEARVAAAAPASATNAGGGDAAAGGWQPGWGLYEFEMSRGALLSEALPMLVLPDSQAAAAAELATLPAGRQAAVVLRLTAAVARYLQQRDCAVEPAQVLDFETAYPPVAMARVAAAARLLSNLAQRAGWPATARMVQPAIAADSWYTARRASQQPAATSGADEADTAAVAVPPAAAQCGGDEPPKAAAKLAGSSARDAAVFGKAGLTGNSLAQAAGGSGKEMAWGKLAEEAGMDVSLSDSDCMGRTMHPAVLAGVTVLVVGMVMGLGAAMASGSLG